MNKGIGIYIHIPFCSRKCKYCSFYSVPLSDGETVEQYVNELIFEIITAARTYPNKKVSTIYFGGGTPSLLTIDHFYRIVDAVYRHFEVDLTEFTIEVNPNSSQDLEEYKRLGANRISVGVQSLDDEILQKLGRLHNANEAISSLAKAASIYPNVSADLILGVSEKQDVVADADAMYPYITHLSAYMLSVENGTPLKREIEEKKVSVATEDAVINQYNDLYFYCVEHNLYRYEVSNFAHIGAESKHNQNYWAMGEYLGFGPGAHSYINGVRYYNRPSLTSYLNGKNSAFNEAVKERQASVEEDKEEFIMLALRTSHGVDLNEYREKFQEDFLSVYSDKIKKMDEYLAVTKGSVRIRPQFFLVQNTIIGELL